MELESKCENYTCKSCEFGDCYYNETPSSEDFNLLREKVDKVIDSYASIIDHEEKDEVQHLGNDLMTVFRDFLSQVKVEVN